MRAPRTIAAVLILLACVGTHCTASEPVPATGKRVINLESEAQQWAFRPPTTHPAPSVQNRSWPKKTHDFFVLSALERRKLRPVRTATKVELIRRATFDLIGLPPKPEECDAFEQDTGPDAFAKVVQRLLDSPHYGERWGRYWLDVARYADDQGNSFLTPTPSAYLYRDWVVNAFNRDLPYDEFIRLQIAGDEIPGPASDYVTRLAGLGFQGLGPQFRKGAAGEAKAKADELEDRIDTLSRGILGLTVSCARCHDHKFDPIPMRDYYSMAAAYNGAEWPNRMLAAPAVVEAHKKWGERVEQKKAETKKWLEDQARLLGRRALPKAAAYVTAACKLVVARHQKLPVDESGFAKQEGLEFYFLNRWAKLLDEPGEDAVFKTLRFAVKQAKEQATIGTSEALRNEAASLNRLIGEALTALAAGQTAATNTDEKASIPSADQNKLLATLWKEAKAPFFVEEKYRDSLLDDPQKKQLAEFQAQLAALSTNPPPSGPLMPSVQGGGQAMHVFVRGNPENPGEEAPAGFLRVLNKNEGKPDAKRFTRLDLANAIVRPQNPLTARVLVNRIWHYHFGRGIVATLSNFGKLGSAPTHPELLDTLAVQFVEAGWSIKWLHREIMLSATYQLSSDQDPDNMLIDPGNEQLWRMTPRRLDFEAWRDALLSIAGKLDLRVGGASVDQANPGLKEVADFNFFTRLNGTEADDPDGTRRTLYTVVSRYAPNITMTLFDFPEPNVTSDQRNATIVPQQQLFVLNSAFMIKMSREFALRLQKSCTDDRDRLLLGWRLAYGRPPLSSELAMGLEFLQAPNSDAASPAPNSLNRWEQLSHALLASNELMFLP